VGEKDRWHQLAGAVQDSNMPASDKSVFRYLLDCADYVTADLPAKFTPTRKTIGRKTSLSRSQVGYSARHLVKHGWLVVTGHSGPGHPLSYALSAGSQCDCTGRVHVADVADVAEQPESAVTEHTHADQQRWHRVADVADIADSAGDGLATVPASGNSANRWHRTVPTNGANAAGQTVLSTERHREGEVVRERDQKQRDVKTSRLPPDWPLIRQVVRTVHNAPGGGLHRAELAEQLGLPPASPVLREALMIAYRNRKIDFCRQYVVKPAERP
jgi:hypothetical protein